MLTAQHSAAGATLAAQTSTNPPARPRAGHSERLEMVTKEEKSATLVLAALAFIIIYCVGCVYGFFKDIFNDHALWAIAGFISGGLISFIRAIGYMLGYY